MLSSLAPHESLHALARARLATIHGAPTPFDKPQIPSAWSASVGSLAQPFFPPGAPATWSLANLDSDAQLKRSASLSSQKLDFAPMPYVGTPHEYLNYTRLAYDKFSGIVMNGQTLDMSRSYPRGSFQDIFGWIKYATPGGDVVYNQTTCQAWSLYAPSSNASLYLLTTPDAKTPGFAKPVYFEENVTISQGGQPFLYRVKYDFLDWRPNSALPLWATFNESDFTSPAACPLPPGGAVPAPTTRDIYVFHPAADFTLANQDAADALGDTLFMCVEGLSKGYMRNNSVTHWSVEWVPRWGQYENCQGWGAARTCLGDEHFWVGHEAALGVGYPTAGQCVANPLIGEWWSLPIAGKCADGATPGDGTCTWKPTHVKTIDAACLLDDDHKFAEACAAESRAPFKAAAAIFEAGFASEDVAKGGCPGLPGPGRR